MQTIKPGLSMGASAATAADDDDVVVETQANAAAVLDEKLCLERLWLNQISFILSSNCLYHDRYQAG